MKRFISLSLALLATMVCAQEPRNLLVDVRVEGGSQSASQGFGLGVRERISLQGGERTVTRSQNAMQRLLVMDGGTATLSAIQTQPMRLRQVVMSPYGKVLSEQFVFRSLGGAVRVTPRTSGNRVVIEVSAEEAQAVPNQPMAAQTLRVMTQVSGEMGEWILIGDDERSDRNAREGAGLGGVYRQEESSTGSQRVWLRVNAQ